MGRVNRSESILKLGLQGSDKNKRGELEVKWVLMYRGVCEGVQG